MEHGDFPVVRVQRPLESLDLWKYGGTERPGDESKVTHPGKAGLFLPVTLSSFPCQRGVSLGGEALWVR